MHRSVWVVLAAAGQGVRARGDIPKQFRRLGDSTVLQTALARLFGIPEVAGVVVALPPEGIPPAAGLTTDDITSMGDQARPVITVAGGATRQESVLEALQLVPESARWVAVHDAARPFFTPELFSRVLEACSESGAAVPGITPSDTIKWLDAARGNVVRATLDRAALSAVQTPQIFDRKILLEAYLRAKDEGYSATDDSELVERVGVSVVVVPGEPGNIKITYPEDFERAEALLSHSASRTSSFSNYVGNRKPRVTVTGFGLDVHPFGPGRRCVIGGADIPHDMGLVGHSDADVLLHAIMDAILGALAAGDIGKWFPEEPRYKDASSLELLRMLWGKLRSKAEIIHIDSVIVAEAPRIAPYSETMRENVAAALEISVEQVSIKATTSERLGFTGRREGIAAFCTATLQKDLP